MNKKYFLIAIVLIGFNTLSAQLKSLNVKITDDLIKHSSQDVNHSTNSKRSASNPKACGVDTVEFPRYRGTAFFTVTVSQGRSLGQLYECPQPLVLSGFTFYAFVAANPPSPKKMNLICNVYNAGSDSLPTGSPLRSDTILIDSTFGGGLLSRIEKHASFKPITLTGKYIITIETDSANLNAGLVTNSYSAGNGQRHNLNCGSISGLWYNGRNLNIGGVSFNCDILLHPHVKYDIGADFRINNNCYNLSDTVKFTNESKNNIIGSRVYNRYEFFNLGYICHNWNNGINPFQNFNSVDYAVKYSSKSNYQVRVISRIYGYRGANFNGCVDTAIKDLNFKPETPSISGLSNVCIGDSSKYIASSTDLGVVFEWSKPNSNTPFFTGNEYKISQVTKNDTFLVRANNNGCYSNTRQFIIRANSYPTSLTFKDDSVCSGSRGIILANSNIGTISWYYNINDNAPFFTGNSFQTPVLNTTTSYFIEANNLGCKLTPRKEVKVNVGSDFAPLEPVLSNDTNICLSSSTSLTINSTVASGLTVRWYDIASGGTSFSNNSSINFTPTQRGLKTFYAEAYNGVCGSSRVPININVDDFPSFGNLTLPSICKGDSAEMIQLTNFGIVEWFDASSNGNLLNLGTNYKVSPTANTDYFVQASSGICINPNRQKVTLMVNEPPQISTIWGDTICAKNPAKFSVKLSGNGSVKWFDSDTSQTVLGSGNVFVSPSLNGPTRYFAQPENMGCIGKRSSAIPLVRGAPFSGFSFQLKSWQQVTVSPINSGSASIKWYFGDGKTSNNTNETHRYQNPGVYNIKLIVTSISNGCKDSTIIPVTVAESSIQNIDLQTIKAYPNPTNGIINLDLNDLINESTIEVFSLNGEKVKTQLVNTELKIQQLELTNLTSGLYLIRINGIKPFLINKY